MNLADFLLARIAEDEEAARGFCTVLLARDSEPETLYAFEVTGAPGDPVRVLAECEAKRRIVDNHARRFRANGELHDAQTLRLLALPYASHPDYDEAWRP